MTLEYLYFHHINFYRLSQKYLKDLLDKFVKVCKNLCDEKKDIQESLKNIEPENNES